jgi:uncharacterized repeat protein (TIGR03803 family)
VSQSLRKLMLALFAGGLVLSLASNNVGAQTYTDLHDFDCCVHPDHPELLAQGRDGNLYGTLPFGGSFNDGVVFRASTSSTVVTIHDFDGTDGRGASGGLTLGLDGNFYGAAPNGGAFGNGSIFRITPAGTLTVLHDFAADFSEGAFPVAPPVQAVDGSFYGLTSLYLTAYKVSASGKFKLLTSSIPGNSNAPLVQANDGKFYGTTYSGGTIDQGTIFRMSPSGVVKVLYNFDETHGCQPEGPLVQGSDGNFYGTTPRCGALGGGVVFKITPKGVLTVLHNFDSTVTVDGYNPLAGLVLATDGNFYSSASSGGTSGVGVLFRTTRAGSFTVLHDFVQSTGDYPDATPMQHTDGKIYGLTRAGGGSDTGVLYSLDVGLDPFVSLLSTSGKAGQVVQILGQGFTGTTGVKFGTGSASFTVVSDNYMTAAVPASGTTGYVTVTTPSGTLTSSRTFKVLPVIIGFMPTSGPVGTKVTITGSGFIGATKVTFGGVKATSYTVDSGTQITATVPTGAMTGNIVVTTPGGIASKGIFTVS